VLNLDALLRARSVAVVGASQKRDSFGWHVVRQLLDFGYAGRIIPINPSYAKIEGLPCFPSLSDVDEAIDCAAICVADKRVETVLIDAVNSGVPAAVIFGAACGNSDDPASLAIRLTDIAREAKIALMGPNCMGFYNFADRLFLTGYPYHREPSSGTISFITHSGSTLSAVAKNTRGMNFNYVISPGQEWVLSAADYLDFVLHQPETRVVGLFLETIRNPELFLEGLSLANTRDIPVVMLKVGRTEFGARMAMAHTGALAGAQTAIEAVADRYGVSLVRTIEELLDTLELFASQRRPSTSALAAITDSGGERGMLVDLAADVGVKFAELGAPATRILEAHLDPGLVPGNPADLWGSGRDWQRVYRACIGAMLADDAVGAFNFGIDFNIGSRLGPDYLNIAIEAFGVTDKPFAVIANVASGISPGDAKQLRAAGVPVLEGTETGLLAFKHLFAYREVLRNSQRSAICAAPTPLAPKLQSLLGLDRALTEDESESILVHFGLERLPGELAHSLESAVGAARAIGYPVVVKTATIGATHKSDKGGVHLNLRDGSEVSAAYRDIQNRFGPEVLVQSQMDLSQGIELYFGMTVDPQFGPLITVGLGGIWIETLRDSVSFLVPCTASEVIRRLPTLRGFKLLGGVRGREPIDIDALARLVERFSVAAAALSSDVAEIDVNPLLAVRNQFTMLDALIVPINATNAGTNRG
jgi:acetate---CoA ligase (ADP-forming)